MKHLLLVLAILCAPAAAFAQLTAPTSVTATAKGPDQINLTWTAASSAGYGYLILIQSAGDSRYPVYTILQPIPDAAGYTAMGTSGCNISDPTGQYVYNAPNKGIPTWVTESQYIDPQDGTAVQYPVFGLKPNVSYSFEVKSFAAIDATVLSAPSTPATATTSNYTVRYVSLAGSNSHGGTNPTTDAWRTIDHAATTVTAGTVVLIEAGTYANDQIWPTNGGSSASAKIVFEADTGASVILSAPPLQGVGTQTFFITTNFVGIDGLQFVADILGDYAGVIAGNHDFFVNSVLAPDPVTLPTYYEGLLLEGPESNGLIQGNSIHDFGMPCNAQNPDGGDGFPLALLGSKNDVIQYNHITRGAHDDTLCKGIDSTHRCTNERSFNNIMDGGYAMGFNTVFYGENTIFEGNIVFFPGVLEATTGIYKPDYQASGVNTTIRRTLGISPSAYGVEISALNGINNTGVLIYNNVWYHPANGGCFWMSDMMTADSDTIANNICPTTVPFSAYTSGTLAYTFILDTTNAYKNNDFVYTIANIAQPAALNYLWDLNGATACTSAPCSIATMESTFSTWTGNAALLSTPCFGNVVRYDFHLTSGCSLLAAGAAVTDTAWGSFSAGTNLGPYNSVFVPQVPGTPSKFFGSGKLFGSNVIAP